MWETKNSHQCQNGGKPHVLLVSTLVSRGTPPIQYNLFWLFPLSFFPWNCSHKSSLKQDASTGCFGRPTRNLKNEWCSWSTGTINAWRSCQGALQDKVTGFHCFQVGSHFDACGGGLVYPKQNLIFSRRKPSKQGRLSQEISETQPLARSVTIVKCNPGYFSTKINKYANINFLSFRLSKIFAFEIQLVCALNHRIELQHRPQHKKVPIENWHCDNHLILSYTAHGAN